MRGGDGGFWVKLRWPLLVRGGDRGVSTGLSRGGFFGEYHGAKLNQVGNLSLEVPNYYSLEQHMVGYQHVTSYVSVQK